METKRKLRKTIKALDSAVRALSRRIETLNQEFRDLRKANHGASISIPVVDTAGATVLEERNERYPPVLPRYAKTHSITLVRFVQELEECTSVSVCWSQNEGKVVVYDTEEDA